MLANRLRVQYIRTRYITCTRGELGHSLAIEMMHNRRIRPGLRGGFQLTSELVLKLIFNVQVVAAKLEEEQAAETKILQDDQKEEPNQDSYEEKQDDSTKNGTENLKENQTLPNGEVLQDEDEGVDLRGSVHLKK